MDRKDFEAAVLRVNALIDAISMGEETGIEILLRRDARETKESLRAVVAVATKIVEVRNE